MPGDALTRRDRSPCRPLGLAFAQASGPRKGSTCRPPRRAATTRERRHRNPGIHPDRGLCFRVRASWEAWAEILHFVQNNNGRGQNDGGQGWTEHTWSSVKQNGHGPGLRRSMPICLPYTFTAARLPSGVLLRNLRVKVFAQLGKGLLLEPGDMHLRDVQPLGHFHLR